MDRTPLDLVTDQQPGGRAVADSPAIESGCDIKSFRLFFGLADIRYAIRSVVVLVEPPPFRLLHRKILVGPLIQLAKVRSNVALLSRDERRPERDQQGPFIVASHPY